ncbi:MAG: family 16 glycosylhydrolase [Bacteroidota bacterium]|nr:family 16 glycosylhydrolase [Bacteroidota bacterium]
MHYKRTLFLFIELLFLYNLGKAQVGQIIWQDDFNSVDPTIWNTVVGNGCDQAEGCGWGNKELEYYQGNNVTIEPIAGEPGNNALVIQAKKETVGTNQFTSAKLTSLNKMAIKYGVIEVRMKSPNIQTGLWPAVWLLGTNQKSIGWPKCGEMDMMEMGQSSAERAKQGSGSASLNNYVGSNLIWYSPDACTGANATCAASIAYDADYDQPYVSNVALNDRFVIYRMYWDDKSIRFTVEDNGFEYDLYTTDFPISSKESVFQQPFYFIMNLAVGGIFTDAASSSQVTAPLPGKMYIDYVRVRKWNGKGEVILPGQLMANAGPDQVVNAGEAITLDAGGSYGNIATYAWLENGTQIATGKTTTLTLSAGTHLIDLTVADNNGNKATDQVSVQVGTSAVGEVIWQEDFNSFNSDIWNAVNSNGCDGASGCGFGNHELEYYNGENNLSIEPITGEPGNNALVIQAKKETIGTNQFSSAKITTQNKLAIKYGMIEVRLKTPNLDSGLWPAVWLLGTNYSSVGWPYCGEMDMMEMGHKASEKARLGHAGAAINNYVGANLIWYTGDACAPDNSSCAASIAYDVNYNKPYIASSGLNNRFVIYRMYWDESSIRLTVVDNGVEKDLYATPFPITAKESAFQQPYFFLLNLALGGDFTDASTPNQVTAPVPAKMYVDYIKVCKYNGKGEVSFNGGNIIADAGPDQVKTDLDRNGSESVTLDASSSYGNITSYVWSESGVQLATGKNPTVNLANGDHYITLTATDNTGKTSTDEVHIDVREILWEDNFNTLNTEFWTPTTGNGCGEASGCGFGNQELESYSPNNLTIEPITGEAGNNALVIQAKKEVAGTNQFTSGKLTTQGKMSVRYGLVEIRLKTPDVNNGLWPAVWLLGANQSAVGWPKCGEIDMMEMGHSSAERTRQGFSTASPNNFVGSNLLWYSADACSGTNATCAASIAYDNNYDQPYVSGTGLNNRFAIYRMYWDDKSIRFTVEDDGKEVDLYTTPFPISANEAAFKQPFYVLLNLAVGGSFTDAATANQVTAPFPAKMMIDYVRIMKWNGKGEVTFKNSLVANAGSDIVALDKDKNGTETVVLDGSGSSNLDGTISSYSWTENGVEIATGAMPTLQMSRGIHTITLTVTDGNRNTATDQVIVTVTTGGSSPTANAGPDITINDDNGDDLVTLTLDGSGSTDPNDAALSYSWKENDIEIATGVKPTVTLKTGKHTITLNVANADKLSGSDDILINVIDPDNNPPVANAGSDKTYNVNSSADKITLTLDGSGSSDSDGTIVSYVWKENGLVIGNGKSTSMTLPTGKHKITLEVTDNDGIMSADDVLITIVNVNNIAPVANAGSNVTIVDTDKNGSESVTLDGSLSTDADGTIVNYSWIEDNVEIGNGKTAAVTLSLGIHVIKLEITDNDGTMSNATVTIKVTQKPVASAGADIKMIDTDKNGSETVTLNGSMSSAPYGTLVNYSWTENNVEIATGKMASYNFNKGTHAVTLTVTNDLGITDSDLVSVIIASPDNIIPVARVNADTTVVDNDNKGAVSFVLNGSKSTDTDGTIIGYVWMENGVVIATEKTQVVNLSVGVHNILLTVTDNEGATSNASFVVTVKQGLCSIEVCTKDYTAKVISDNASNTTITFVPAKTGIGNTTCLLYYGTIENGQFPGNNATPNVPFKVTNVTMGQKVYFYFTYNMVSGGENNTLSCKQNFAVGSCASPTEVEIPDDIDVKLYPSPVADVLRVSCDKGTVERILVFDTYGNKVQEEKNTSQINMSRLSIGLYIIRVTIEGKTIARKVIKK